MMRGMDTDFSRRLQRHWRLVFSLLAVAVSQLILRVVAAVIPADWRERIERARRVAEEARQHDTAWIVRYQPLQPCTTTLRPR